MPCTGTTAPSTFRTLGLRIALDDVGVGYSGLERILRLQPDLIKLDYVVTHDIQCDQTRVAMVTAMRLVASAVGATLVAEGVETQAELDTLIDLGVHTAQGYLLGKPQHAPTERR